MASGSERPGRPSGAVRASRPSLAENLPGSSKSTPVVSARPISKIRGSSIISPWLPVKVPLALIRASPPCAGCPCRFSISAPCSHSFCLSRPSKGHAATIAIWRSGTHYNRRLHCVAQRHLATLAKIALTFGDGATPADNDRAFSPPAEKGCATGSRRDSLQDLLQRGRVAGAVVVGIDLCGGNNDEVCKLGMVRLQPRHWYAAQHAFRCQLLDDL